MAKPSVTCYADPDKPRTGFILQKFAQGSKGAVVFDGKYREGPSAFFGVQPNTRAAFVEATRSDNIYPWYYIDNGYFSGIFKGALFFRVTKGQFQYHGKSDPDYDRLKAQGITVAPWRTGGDHILFCPPGEHWMRNVLDRSAVEWRENMRPKIAQATDLPVIERLKPKNIHEYRESSAEVALQNCAAVVTFTSNISLQAICRGIPVFCSPMSTASYLGVAYNNYDLPDLNKPYLPSVAVRKSWMATLANKQWTLDEFADGTTWRSLTNG
jgi:hypothetical protein